MITVRFLVNVGTDLANVMTVFKCDEDVARVIAGKRAGSTVDVTAEVAAALKSAAPGGIEVV